VKIKTISIIRETNANPMQTWGGIANNVFWEMEKATIETIPLASTAYTFDKWFCVFGVLIYNYYFVNNEIVYISLILKTALMSKLFIEPMNDVDIFI